MCICIQWKEEYYQYNEIGVAFLFSNFTKGFLSKMTVVSFKALGGISHISVMLHCLLHFIKNNTFELQIFLVASVVPYHPLKGCFDFVCKLNQHTS